MPPKGPRGDIVISSSVLPRHLSPPHALKLFTGKAVKYGSGTAYLGCRSSSAGGIERQLRQIKVVAEAKWSERRCKSKWSAGVAPDEKINIWLWWRNTGDEYEIKIGNRSLRIDRPGGRHSLLEAGRELAARRPVRLGWRTPGCSAGHPSARPPGFSISFHGSKDPARGTAFANTRAIQPSGDRTVQPTRIIAAASPASILKHRVLSAVPTRSNTSSPNHNTAC